LVIVEVLPNASYKTVICPVLGCAFDLLGLSYSVPQNCVRRKSSDAEAASMEEVLLKHEPHEKENTGLSWRVKEPIENCFVQADVAAFVSDKAVI